jgi:hypothetical protein
LGAALTPRARNLRTGYASAAYHVVAGGNQGRKIYGNERDRKLRRLLPTNRGVVGSRSTTAGPLAERGEENLATR